MIRADSLPELLAYIEKLTADRDRLDRLCTRMLADIADVEALCGVPEEEAGNLIVTLVRETLTSKDEQLARGRALIENWRWDAEVYQDETYNDCADELEAALASPAAEPEFSPDRNMLLLLLEQFENEVTVCEACGHGESTSSCDSAHMLRAYLNQPASTTEPNYSAIGAAIEEAIDDLCPKYTQDNRPHPHDTDNPDYTRLHLVDFKEVARRALAAAQPAPVVQQLDIEGQIKEGE